MAFAEEFDAPELDTSGWLPHYLPAWSSRAATAATYEIGDAGRVFPDRSTGADADAVPELVVDWLRAS